MRVVDRTGTDNFQSSSPQTGHRPCSRTSSMHARPSQTHKCRHGILSRVDWLPWQIAHSNGLAGVALGARSGDAGSDPGAVSMDDSARSGVSESPSSFHVHHHDSSPCSGWIWMTSASSRAGGGVGVAADALALRPREGGLEEDLLVPRGCFAGRPVEQSADAAVLEASSAVIRCLFRCARKE